MYVKWREHRDGRIWVSTLGLKAFVETCLLEGLSCRDVEYLDAQDQFLISLLVDESVSYDRDVISQNLVESLASLGLESSVSWKRTSDEESEPSGDFFESPWFWGVLCSSIAALWRLGLSGVSWCLLFGSLGYVGCIAVRSETGRGFYNRIVNLFKEMID
ncbi:MAG: hypothetical protein CSA35_03650 [Dethiosulfovibrio peptidovorans]|nr:MAG: hypothetical protein CSA35_03650 [Dethiosulfovibrio peptidovorans]